MRAGQLIFKWRDLLVPVVLIGIGLGTRPRLSGGTTRTDHAADAIGLALALFGQVIRALVIGLVYITRGGQNRQIWANALVEGGIFAHCRNPLYLGNILIVTGLAIVHGGWAMLLVIVPLFVLAYAAIVRAEEHYLHDRFGEHYARYCARVRRWQPRLRGLSRTLRAGRFDWLKLVRKEYGTPFGWLSGFLVLLLMEHRYPPAAPLARPEVAGIVAAWCVSTALYLTARRLKFRGRLGQG